MTADITLRGPGDVVAILPYQLGYHPRDSAVVISLRGKRVGLVARTDLPPEEHVDEVVSTLMGPLVRDGATSVIVVGYEDDPDASQPLLLALVEQLERAGIDVVDVAVVRDGRRYSPICSEPCCPPDGVALPDPADVPGVAEYVALGRSPLRSRGDVEGLVAPEPWRCLGVERAIEARSRMPRARRRSVAAWRAVLDPGERGRRPPDRRVVADLALGLADIPWRDGLIAWLVPSVLPTEVDRPEGDGAAAVGAADLGRHGRRPRSTVRPVRGCVNGRRATPSPSSATTCCTACWPCAGRCPTSAPTRRQRCAPWRRTWPGSAATVRSPGRPSSGPLRLAPGYRLARLLERLVDNGLRLPPVSRGAGRPTGEASAGLGEPAARLSPAVGAGATAALGTPLVTASGRGYHGCRS